MVFFKSDERGKKGDSTNKIFGAVNRVDNPAGRGVSGLLAEFFAQKAIVREVGVQHIDNARFTLPVGSGDWRAISFELNRQIGFEIAQSNFASGVRSLHRSEQNRVHARATPGPPHRRSGDWFR